MKTALLRIVTAATVVLFAAHATHGAPRVGLLLKGRSAFWSAVEAGARTAAEKQGAEVIVKAPLTETDAAVQIQLLNALATQAEMAGIVVAPISKDALSGPVAALVAKGVKIVVIDSPLADGTAPVFVGTDQRAAGEAAGRLLAAAVGDNDEISFLKHNQAGGATALREQGALEVLRAAHPKITVHGDIYSSSEAGKEAERAAFLLTKYPGTKAIVASSTPGTMAMLRMLSSSSAKRGIRFVGFGYNLNPEVAAALESGVMHGWVAQLPTEVGAVGVESLLALAGGKSVPAVVHTDFLVITKENLGSPAVQALLK